MIKRIYVIDGQGGGIGATLVRYLRDDFGDAMEILAIGLNAIATSQMLKAGANQGASGENALCRAAELADFIMGPIAVTWADAMFGEVTPRMARALVTSPAVKILLPLSQEHIEIVGVAREPLPHLVQAAVKKVREVMGDV